MRRVVQELYGGFLRRWGCSRRNHLDESRSELVWYAVVGVIESYLIGSQEKIQTVDEDVA